MIEEYRFSPLLFVQKDGAPFEFYMRSCSEKSKVEPLIERGGGALYACYKPGRIRLVEPGSKFMNLKEGEEALSLQFVHDCIKRNRLLDMKSYKLELKSMDTSDISEDSGSLKGGRTKRPRNDISKGQSRQAKTVGKTLKFPVVILEDCLASNKNAIVQSNPVKSSNTEFSLSPTCISETPESVINMQNHKNQAEHAGAEISRKQASLESSSDYSVVAPTYLQSQGRHTNSQTSAASSDRTVSLNDALINDTGGFTPSFENNRDGVSDQHLKSNGELDDAGIGFMQPLMDELAIIPVKTKVEPERSSQESVETNISDYISQQSKEQVSNMDNMICEVEQFSQNAIPNGHTVDTAPACSVNDAKTKELEKLDCTVNPEINMAVNQGSSSEAQVIEQQNNNKVETTSHVPNLHAEFGIKAFQEPTSSSNIRGVKAVKSSKKRKLFDSTVLVTPNSLRNVKSSEKSSHSPKNLKTFHATSTPKTRQQKVLEERNLQIRPISVGAKPDVDELSNASEDSTKLDDLEGLKKFLRKNNIGEQHYSGSHSNDNLQNAEQPTSSSSVDEMDIVKEYVCKNLDKVDKLDEILAATTTADFGMGSDQSQLTLTSSEGSANLTVVRAENTSSRTEVTNQNGAEGSENVSPIASVCENVSVVAEDSGVDDLKKKLMDNTASFYTPNCSLNQSVSNDSTPDQLEEFEKPHLNQQSYHQHYKRAGSMSSVASGFTTADETMEEAYRSLSDAISTIESCDLTNGEAIKLSPKSTSPSLISKANTPDWNTSMEVHPPMSVFASEASTVGIDEDDAASDIIQIFSQSSRNSINAGSQLEIAPRNVPVQNQEDSPVPQDIDPFSSSGSQQTASSTRVEDNFPPVSTKEVLSEAMALMKSSKNMLSSLKSTVPGSTVNTLRNKIDSNRKNVHLLLLKLEVEEIAKKPTLSLEDKCVLAKYLSLKKRIPYHQFLCDIVNQKSKLA